MSCQDFKGDCRQGRDCPHRKYFNLGLCDRSVLNLYNTITKNFTLIEWLVCLIAIGILLSLAI
jgi:prepilin-type N-terminal cleavage/methylation domain-containing protein